jgi:hypothetical protein
MSLLIFFTARVPSIRSASGRRGSNPRHQAWKACALPTELLPRETTTSRPEHFLCHSIIDFRSPLFEHAGRSLRSRLSTRYCRRATLVSIQPPIDGGGRIRTFVGVSRQIYSLLPLAAWVPHPFPAQCDPTPVTPPSSHANEAEHPTRADGENRTRNRLITNQVLCQLSYVSVSSDQRTAFLRKTHRITRR